MRFGHGQDVLQGTEGPAVAQGPQAQTGVRRRPDAARPPSPEAWLQQRGVQREGTRGERVRSREEVRISAETEGRAAVGSGYSGAGAEITVETLAKAGFSDNKNPKIKILGTGELTKKFTVKVPCSASAKAKIEKAGGSVA